ncbi:nitroreductase family protein [Desulfovibrio sp. OttesenSCG-928-C14]|nr:nitroreductase family protein [Desulfovibrio sp. OttesenSCG-928-C14]
METLKAIHSRRSVRKYTAEKVSEQDLRKLLDAAMVAPSAGNAQPWHFIIIDDPEILKQIPALNQYAAMAKNASLAILVCADLKLEKYPGFWVQDCAAAVQNMLLAACDLGLGAVWTGIEPIPERGEGFAKLFKLPENVKPLGLVVIGHPDQQGKEEIRFKPDRVHRNQW